MGTQPYSRKGKPQGHRDPRIQRRRGCDSRWLLCICGLLLQIQMGGWLEAQSADATAAIAGMQRRYAAIHTLRVEFTQHYRGPAVDQTESGTMYMKKPGLMRWEYRNPEVKLFIADGRQTYLYTPEDRQVLVQRFTAEDLRSTPLQFLLGQGDVARTFEVSWDGNPAPGDKDLVFRLTPRAAESEYAYLVVASDRTSFEMRRLVIHERNGNTSEFVFRDMQANVKIDAKQFEFKIPKGVEVVRLDEK
jgi:outer membrane lipoprotein carrier protein